MEGLRAVLGRLSRALAGLFFLGAAAVAAAAPSAAPPEPPPCRGPALPLERLAPGLWWLPAAPGDADAVNGGRVSNLVVARHGGRVWVLGSGPTPAAGRALACEVRRRWHTAVTDVISPWPRPELVLGAAGLSPARHWAHAEVAEAMRQRCAGCVERLRARLGAAGDELDGAAVQWPTHLLHGESGRLGPWHWWRLSRGNGHPVTVWQFGTVALRMAPGLLWAPGAPDGRDADLRVLARSTAALEALPGAKDTAAGNRLRWLGEQGPPSTGLPAHHRRYWDGLQQAVDAAQAAGALESAPAPGVADVPADDPRHALNWQRAWRQREDEEFQRSLR